MDVVIEVDVPQGAEIDKRFWHQSVLEIFKGQCANCGSDHKVSPRLVIPETQGGKHTLGNSTLWCRACELVANTAPTQDKESRRIVNIWVSKRMYDSLNSIKEEGKIASMGNLVRSLIEGYVQNVDRYDDLDRYQDVGSDVRLNVWVDHSEYATFKQLTEARGLTVTAALKALICIYEAETGTRPLNVSKE